MKRSDQLAMINGGWTEFCRAHRLIIGRTYVFKFRIDYSGWEVTLYPV